VSDLGPRTSGSNRWRGSADIPEHELRRAAVSVTANLVEACARRSERDYLRVISIAIGSASELAMVSHTAMGVSLERCSRL
jgi:four helix bundle protein